MQETASQVIAAALAIGGFVLLGSSQALTVGLLAKIIAYIRYLDIDYSPELKDLLHQESSLVALNLIPDLPEAIQKRIPSVEMPHMFEEYGLEAPFLANFWPNLFAITIAFIMFLVLVGLQRAIKSNSKSKLAFVIRKLYLAAVNFLIIQVYCSFDEITLFFILQVKFLSFDSEFSYLSLVLSIGFTIIGLASIGFHIFLIKKYQAIKSKPRQNQREIENFIKKNEGISIFFQDFKDTTSVQQSYLLLFIIRNILSNMLLGAVYPHPITQTTCFVGLSLILMSYIFIQRPFIGRLDFLEQIFYEGIILVTNIFVFIMSLKQENKTLYDVRQPLGKGVIMMSLIFNIGAFVLMFGRILILLYTSIKSWRAKRQNNNKVYRINSLAIIDTDSKLPLDISNSKQNLSLYQKNQMNFVSPSEASLIKENRDMKENFLKYRKKRIKNTLQNTSSNDSFTTLDEQKYPPAFTPDSVKYLHSKEKALNNNFLRSKHDNRENPFLNKKNLNKRKQKDVGENEIHTINKLNNPQSMMQNYDQVNIKSKSRKQVRSKNLENSDTSQKLSNFDSSLNVSLNELANSESLNYYSHFKSQNTSYINSDSIGAESLNNRGSNYILPNLRIGTETFKTIPNSVNYGNQKGVDNAVRRWRLKRAQNNAKFLNLEDSSS